MSKAVLLQPSLTSNVKSLILDQFNVLFSFRLHKANISPCGGGGGRLLFAYCHLSASGLGAMTLFPWQLNVRGATISS